MKKKFYLLPALTIALMANVAGATAAELQPVPPLTKEELDQIIAQQ